MRSSRSKTRRIEKALINFAHILHASASIDEPHLSVIIREYFQLPYWHHSWILNTLPNTRIILKSGPLSDIVTQNLLREMSIQNGVSPGRIIFISFVPSQFKHLALYNRIDIGLDTFPYNGATTTCEAMWMGVPVITLAGETHVSRLGGAYCRVWAYRNLSPGPSKTI